MTRIKFFNTREEEKAVALAWAERNNITLDLTDKELSLATLDEVKGYDGVSLTQIAPVEPELYPQLKALGIKQLSQRSAGVDMYDLELARQNDITVTNVPSYSPESIGEFTALIGLNLVRHYDRIKAHVQEHNFAWTPDLRGRVVGEMTVAVIGTGRIGQSLARIFKGFGAKIVGYDVYPNPNLGDLLEYKATIEEAVAEADIVSIHMPATEETHHMFNADLFSHFKKGAILLNMARGAVLDTQDLLDALDNGTLAGAGIDTYEFEGPYVPKNNKGVVIEDDQFLALINHPNVIYTPHVAFYTDEAVKNLVETSLNAALDVIQKGSTQFSVN